MPDLLLELFSEEIPARMQARAAEDLQKLVTDALVDAGSSTKAPRPSRRRGGWRSPCRRAGEQPRREGGAQRAARRRAGGGDRRAS